NSPLNSPLKKNLKTSAIELLNSNAAVCIPINMGNVFRAVAGLLSIVLICLCTSCGTETHEAATPTTTSATEDVAHAVQLYGQREDLMRLREGIVSLRQARTKDPGNYEAAWQLAKFNYYL